MVSWIRSTEITGPWIRDNSNQGAQAPVKVTKEMLGEHVSMAIQKSPVMAMKFPQVYLRLFHFAAQA